MKKLLIILSVICISCKSDVELAMERGIQYFEWNRLDKSIIEFNHVVHLLSDEPETPINPIPSEALAYRMATKVGKAFYAIRKTTIEPTFPQPIIPSVLPNSSVPMKLFFPHFPA